jgi:hypothetical protein
MTNFPRQTALRGNQNQKDITAQKWDIAEFNGYELFQKKGNSRPVADFELRASTRKIGISSQGNLSANHTVTHISRGWMRAPINPTATNWRIPDTSLGCPGGLLPLSPRRSLYTLHLLSTLSAKKKTGALAGSTVRPEAPYTIFTWAEESLDCLSLKRSFSSHRIYHLRLNYLHLDHLLEFYRDGAPEPPRTQAAWDLFLELTLRYWELDYKAAALRHILNDRWPQEDIEKAVRRLGRLY